MSNLPDFEEVKPFLPGTFKDVYSHFPNVSSRGLRNKLTLWVKQGKLFVTTCKSETPGKPSNFYTLTRPESGFYKAVEEFCDAYDALKFAEDKAQLPDGKSVARLISAYNNLGNLMMKDFIRYLP